MQNKKVAYLVFSLFCLCKSIREIWFKQRKNTVSHCCCYSSGRIEKAFFCHVYFVPSERSSVVLWYLEKQLVLSFQNYFKWPLHHEWIYIWHAYVETLYCPSFHNAEIGKEIFHSYTQFEKHLKNKHTTILFTTVRCIKRLQGFQICIFSLLKNTMEY